jgi:hypothetical protein
LAADVARAVLSIDPGCSLGNEELYGLIDEFLTRVAEQLFRSGIDQSDQAVSINADGCIICCFEDVPELGFATPALGDLSNRSRDYETPVQARRRQGDLDGKIGAVPAPGCHVHRRHRPEQPIAKVGGSLSGIDAAKCTRHQELHRLADQLLPPVAEERLCSRVHKQDGAVAVDADDRARNRLQKRRE